MPFWLARTRDGQECDWIQRFDPRFWTVDFPRPAMAALTTPAPDALRVDLEFHHRDALAGLIWHSADAWDHPLLGYDTDRDYAHTVLRFRWRSGGIVALDQVDGPTLTIEGHDAAGAPRSWYVRLWNYAAGTPEDALVTLPFSALAGGWEADDPVHPGAIDRLFVSLVPPGYRADDPGRLPARADGWVELTGIACDGERAMLRIGDVLVPPHGLGIATAYDDSYNLAPARVLRQLRGLGYRGPLIHYLGMSHCYRLAPVGGVLRAGGDEPLCSPAEAWHREFLTLAAAQDCRPILSLSYELFAEHCPPAWAQRFADGSPALTGWVPPSTLLSPANAAAMEFLRRVAGRLVALLREAGLPVAFQIGEPWWWTDTAGRIALYDDEARAAFGGEPPAIADLRGPLSPEETGLLDAAGAVLATSTEAFADHVRAAAGGEAEVLLLVFTPTVLDPATPELRRANLPPGWAHPAFDRLQVEDYDWLTAGNEGARLAAWRTLDARLGYPPARQDYLAGFVPAPEDAEIRWRRIDAGLERAAARGVARRFVWALPQVARDGFTRLPSSEDPEMDAFDDVSWPLALGRETGVSAEFSTSVATTASGYEHRASHWADARLHFDVGPGIRSEAELGTLLAFFRARRGPARGFRLRDPFDHSSAELGEVPSFTDQWLGTGDGLAVRFRLVKRYPGPEDQLRPITRPVAGSVRVSLDGVELADGWTLAAGGWIEFAEAPVDGAQVRAGFLFDVPVRFAQDRLDLTAALAAGEAPSVPLVELREAA